MIMKENREKVVFFFPWKEVSGGPYYLVRLANALSMDPRYEVYYVDYKKALTDSMRSERVNKIIYSSKFKFPKKKPITLVTPIYWAHMIPELHPKSKIVFFNWHYCCIPVLRDSWRISQDGMHNFLELVNKNNACFFGDITHWLGQNTEDIKFKKIYVPIIVPEKKEIANLEVIEKDIVNIAFLGRLCTDKIFSLLDLLESLNKIHNPNFRKIKVHIIGDGDEKHRLLEKNLNNNIELIFLGTVTGEKLNEYLMTKVDVLFAMGTSVLEGASLHLPSVIIPHNTEEFHCEKYVYLHDSKDYSLGWFDTQMEELDLRVKTAEDILNDLYVENKKRVYGELDYEYCKENHRSNVEFLKRALDESTLTYKNFNDLALKQFYFVKCIRLFHKRVFWIYMNAYHTKVYVSLRDKIRIMEFDKKDKGILVLGHKVPLLHIYNWDYGKIFFIGKIPVFIIRTENDFKY